MHCVVEYFGQSLNAALSRRINMVTFANLGSVRLPNLKFVQAFAFGRYGAFSVPAVYLQQFPSYSNHNCKKTSFLRTPAFIFCLPWGRPCGNHAKRCMNEKTIQCLPNSSQRVPIYLQYFPSYTMLKQQQYFNVLMKNRQTAVTTRQIKKCQSTELNDKMSRYSRR